MDGQTGHVGLPSHRALRRPDHRHRPRDLLLAAQHHLQRLLLVQRLLHSSTAKINQVLHKHHCNAAWHAYQPQGHPNHGCRRFVDEEVASLGDAASQQTMHEQRGVRTCIC